MKKFYKGCAIYWQGENKLEIGEILIADIKEGQALIEVKYCGLCGTDIAIYKGIHPRAKAPLIMGHEFSGVVKQIESDLFRVGDRVIVNPLISCGQCAPCREGNSYVCQNLKLMGIDKDGGFAKYAVVDVDKLCKIPDDLDFMTASLVESFATGVNAFKKASPKKDDLVIVLGGGPIGFATGLYCKCNGINKIYFSEISDYRGKLLRKFGFNVINPQKENLLEKVKNLSDGKFADIVITATGSEGPLFAMVSLAKVLGLIILVGIAHKPQVVDLMNLVFKELTIKGARVYRNEDFNDAIKFVTKNKEILKDYISKIFPIVKLEEALTFASDSEKAAKVMVKIE